MRFLKTFTLCFLLATILSPGVAAQSAKPVKHGECRQEPRFLTQLPLEPTLVRLQFPARFNEQRGKWRVTDESGQLVAEEGCRGQGPCAGYYKKESTKACAVGYIQLALYLKLVKPGRYTIQWIPKSGEGEIGPISLTIKEPVGADKEVYEKLLLSAWGNAIAQADWGGWLEGGYQRDKPSVYSIILEKYPTSTYAGYALGLGQGFHMILDSEPKYVVKTLWQQNYIQVHPKASIHQKVVEGRKAREVWQTEPMPKYLEDQRSRIQNYLVIHPDHPRREVMELAVAFQSLALGDKDTALRALEWVSKNGKTPKWKKQAIDLLKLLKAERSGANG